ncbi:DUF1816 domain-containing protein [Trichocoleus sp. FACHB-69]|nr:DUF1816 domain-containing protein [Trichocoleus sp. FACHB-69]
MFRNITNCIYYFSPFIIEAEAKLTPAGYIDDLEKEGTKGIAVQI